MPKNKQFDEAEVLDKAKEVFSEKGYNGTSMDDLVQATGLSRSSIYDTFGDKHGLFLKSLDQYRCTAATSLQQLLDREDSPKKKIAIVFDAQAQNIIADKKKTGCFLINVSAELSCVDKEIARIASSYMEEIELRFYKWIKEGQAKGEIARRFPPKALAKHLYNSLTGLRMTSRARSDHRALHDIIRIALSVLDE